MRFIASVASAPAAPGVAGMSISGPPTRRRRLATHDDDSAATEPLLVGDAVALYLAHQRRQGRRPETVRHTDMALRAFRQWAGDDSPAGALTLSDVEFGFFSAWENDFES